MKMHQEVAEPYRQAAHAVSDEAFAAAFATDRLFSAETGFEVRGRHQAVPVELIRGVGHAAVNVVEFMAVTDDPTRLDTLANGATVSAMTGDSFIAVGNIAVENSELSTMAEDQLNTLTGEQFRELWHGDFDKTSQGLAHATMQALEQEGLQDRKTIVIAPSLASNVAARAIEHMLNEGIDLRGVGLLDPVGLKPVNALRRTVQYGKVNLSMAPYLAANHPRHAEIAETTGEWFKRSIKSPANFLYGSRGISRSNSQDALLRQADIMRENNVSLRIYAAGASEFNTVPASQETVEELTNRGVNANLTIIDHASHAMTMMSAMHARVVEDFKRDLGLDKIRP